MLHRRKPSPKPTIPNPRIDYHCWMTAEQTENLIRAGLAVFGCVIPEGSAVRWSAPSRRNPSSGVTDERNPSLILEICMSPETAAQFRQPNFPFTESLPSKGGRDFGDEDED